MDRCWVEMLRLHPALFDEETNTRTVPVYFELERQMKGAQERLEALTNIPWKKPGPPRKLKPLTELDKRIRKVVLRERAKGIDLEGKKYCEALHANDIWPEFEHAGILSYPQLYDLSPKWRRKIWKQKCEIMAR
jgi:hypothetical protein